MGVLDICVECPYSLITPTEANEMNTKVTANEDGTYTVTVDGVEVGGIVKGVTRGSGWYGWNNAEGGYKEAASTRAIAILRAKGDHRAANAAELAR